MDRVKARAASMPNPLTFLNQPGMLKSGDGGGGGGLAGRGRGPGQAPNARTMTGISLRQRDPNCADDRLLLNQKCIYERRLPGNSYVTAHITRLQRGYYDSPVVHGDRVDNCRFIAINFVFHPVNTLHRFISARINLSLQDQDVVLPGGLPLPPQLDHPNNARPSLSKVSGKRKPKFLRHAPHLLYGVLSPETLDWTFNLAGSLGVSQGPASASINPSGGIKSSYKVYKMMKIQGSVRTLNSWHGHEYDVEDGSLVWTLEENELQKSGLPREFTFVILFTKGDASSVDLDVDIEPVVGSWYGTYPKWWIDRIWYRPMHKEDIDIDLELGQRFGPATKEEGFNFASLMGTFDDFVTLPGTTYSQSDQGLLPSASADGGSKQGAVPPRNLSASPVPDTNRDLNIRVVLEGYPIAPATTPQEPSNRPSARSHSPASSSGLVISRSSHRNRSRPLSEHYSSPPPFDTPPDSRRRPISAIYESVDGYSPEFDHLGHHQRPSSAATHISDDLSFRPVSPVPRLQISKSLRHSRSRPDLQEEFDASAGRRSQKPSRPPVRIVDLPPEESWDSRSAPSRQPKQSQRLPQQEQNNSNSNSEQAPLRYPRRVGAQPMRRTSNSQQPNPQTSGTSADLKAQNPPRHQSAASQKRLTPRQARNSAYINPVDINHARFKLAEDSPTLPPPPQPLSFPPTSFPNFVPNMTTPLASNPPLSADPTATSSKDHSQMQEHLPLVPMPPQAPSAPGLHGLGVDTLVQQEVANYLKSHPELYSPHSSVNQLSGGVSGRPRTDSALADSMSRSDYRVDQKTNLDSLPMPTPTRPSTAVAANATASDTDVVISKAGPSGKAANGGGSGRHRRSQSANPAGRDVATAELNPIRNSNNASNRYSIRPQDENSAHARKIKDAASSGEFIRVSLGGLGHGGWEYLE